MKLKKTKSYRIVIDRQAESYEEIVKEFDRYCIVSLRCMDDLRGEE